ncbi:uncharacterized protein TNCV_1412811 [Trichonephila clavipes]|nr:uncharacterized protein TNCV_1412811 [Trichonephila clavipes]
MTPEMDLDIELINGLDNHDDRHPLNLSNKFNALEINDSEIDPVEGTSTGTIVKNVNTVSNKKKPATNTTVNKSADLTKNFPPPVMLKITLDFREQMKVINNFMPKIRSKMTGSVIKGLPKKAKPEDIHNDLIDLGFTVDRVSQLTGHLKHLLGDSFRFLCLFNNMTSETVEVARIALRLPPFWKSNVRLWIAQCDHAFTFSGISSDDTKYSALVANLDAETLSYVSDIVLSPPNSDKYHTLSQRLITQFSDSETQKIKKLLTDLQLGDEKLSHLLRKMKELSNGQLQDDFLQSLWLQRMPPHIQTVLSAS